MALHGAIIVGSALLGHVVALPDQSNGGFTELALSTAGALGVAAIGAYAVIRGRNAPTADDWRFAAIENRLHDLEEHVRPWPTKETPDDP